MANIIRITVGGIPYSISCDDDETYAKAIASELEQPTNNAKAKINAITRNVLFIFTPRKMFLIFLLNFTKQTSLSQYIFMLKV